MWSAKELVIVEGAPFHSIPCTTPDTSRGVAQKHFLVISSHTATFHSVKVKLACCKNQDLTKYMEHKILALIASLPLQLQCSPPPHWPYYIWPHHWSSQNVDLLLNGLAMKLSSVHPTMISQTSRSIPCLKQDRQTIYMPLVC